MAHLQQRDFFQNLQSKTPEAFTDVTVLEVGEP
jgi:hypothetical protein